MIGLTTILAFAVTAGLLLYIGYNSREQRLLRIFFTTAGLLTLYAMFSTVGSLSVAYTVPANTISAYYNVTAVHTIAKTDYSFGYVIVVAVILYLAIEVMLYIKEVLRMAALKKSRKFEDALKSD